MAAFLSVMGMYNYDESLFNNFRVPQGVDRETALKRILFDNAELGLVYTDPDIFPVLLENWVAASMSSWERITRALEEEYNPTHNYDRYENWENESDGDQNRSHDVAGFNENNTLVKESAESLSATANSKHSGRTYGNVGVTTAATMITEEIELRSAYNIYKVISDSFKRHFCIMVY